MLVVLVIFIFNSITKNNIKSSHDEDKKVKKWNKNKFYIKINK